MPELVIIFCFIISATIIAFIFGSTIHKRQLAYKERKDALNRENAGANPTESAKRIGQLEDRVRVLERLATDRGRNLAAEIEDLRSLPDIDLAPATREKA